ncbi:MAG: hypothetical protein ABSG12_09090 [Steroidobacteraceae bacterium]|jgi:hypothetical protein
MRIWPLVALVLFAMRSPLALADRDPNSGAPLPPSKHPKTTSPITDHFYIRASYFPPQFRTTLRIDPSHAPAGVTGTSLNGENDLGLPQRMHQGRVDMMFRMRERSKVRIDYFGADRSGSRTIPNEVVLGNTTFAAGSTLQNTLNFEMGDITYTYSFYKTDRFEIGTGVALYLVEARLQAAVPSTFQSQTTTTAGPVPALPLDFTWAISSRFALTARAAYVRAIIDGTRGWFDDLHADAQYRFKPNFAIGIGYSSLHVNITSASGDNPGAIAMSVSGPEAFIRFSF